MKSPIEKKIAKRQLLDPQLRQIDSILINLKNVKDNPEFSRDGFNSLNQIQSELIVLIQSYGESLLNLVSEGYDVD